MGGLRNSRDGVRKFNRFNNGYGGRGKFFGGRGPRGGSNNRRFRPERFDRFERDNRPRRFERRDRFSSRRNFRFRDRDDRMRRGPGRRFSRDSRDGARNFGRSPRRMEGRTGRRVLGGKRLRLGSRRLGTKANGKGMTKEERLNKELESYMNKNPDNVKNKLDSELENYKKEESAVENTTTQPTTA